MTMTFWLLRWVGLAILALLGALTLYASFAAISLRWSLPQLSGEAEVQGPDARLRIVRDRYGIPHIEAQSLKDALFGLGFVHAQDRLWQMEVSRRLVQGRIAEMAGPPAATIDVYLRALGLYRAAQTAAERLSPEAQALTDAYTAGVNAAMAKHKGPLPPEFTIAQITPQAWTRADSVAVVKGLAMQLSANAFRELLRLRLLQSLTPEQAVQYAPPFPRESAEALKALFGDGASKSALGDLSEFEPWLQTRFASNNWVVSGTQSKSGKPLLANDPHLGLSIPAVWYLARLTWPGGEAVGGTIPGAPGVIAGRTQTLAWGLTTTGGDTQDLILERINPKNPDEYLTPEGPKPFERRTETIKVRFGSQRAVTVLSTANGPVIPAEDPRVRALIPDGYALALRWPALEAEDRTLETTLGILTAQDASEASVQRLFGAYKAPLQSFVYAGTDGNIGKIIPGVVPLRNAAQISRGLAPSPGWEAQSRWTGFAPYAQWPHERNGPEGRFWTANNKVVPDSHPYPVALEWDTELRANRIKSLFTAPGPYSLDDMKRMQTDIVDQYAVETLPAMLGLLEGGDARQSQAAALLKAWNGEMANERPEPLIWAAWMRALTKAVFADELGEVFPLQWDYQTRFMERLVAGETGLAAWCDDTATKDKTETCKSVMSEALNSALTELSEAHGADMTAWRWGPAHTATLRHVGFGQVPGLGNLFNIRIQIPGGAHTLNRADHRMSSSAPYAAVHGSGYRGLYDLGDLASSLYMIGSGQSGNVYSPHYADLVPLWAKGEYLKIERTPDPARDENVRVLTLSPIKR